MTMGIQIDHRWAPLHILEMGFPIQNAENKFFKFYLYKNMHLKNVIVIFMYNY